MPVKFSKYNRKLSDIVTNCKFDFRLNFALMAAILDTNFTISTLRIKAVNASVACIIRPLNIDEKSKVKCFASRF